MRVIPIIMIISLKTPLSCASIAIRIVDRKNSLETSIFHAKPLECVITLPTTRKFFFFKNRGIVRYSSAYLLHQKILVTKHYFESINERLRTEIQNKNTNDVGMEDDDNCISALSTDDVIWTDGDEACASHEGSKLTDPPTQNAKDFSTAKNMASTRKNVFPIPDLCPPPPPSLFDKIAQAGNNKEALTNMLMSWYMSGYHTGFYQGMQQAKGEASRRSPLRKQ